MTASSPSHLLLHRILRPPPPPTSFLSSSLPILLPKAQFVSASSSSARCRRPNLHLSSLLLFPNRPLFSSLSTSVSSSSLRCACLPHNSLAEGLAVKDLDVVLDEDIDDEAGGGGGDGDEIEEGSEERVGVAAMVQIPVRSVPMLSVKEKKELASYAHSLGDKLKCQQVGKSGVTANVVMALGETLEANELLKLKIHRTCPGELVDIVSQLEQATGSAAVGQIGRTVIFYRPSVAKHKNEEKKKPGGRIFVRKAQSSRAYSTGKEGKVRNSGHGRRGSSRFD